MDDKANELDAEIRRLEESMARMDAADPEEVESDEYAATLRRLVELREQRAAR